MADPIDGYRSVVSEDGSAPSWEPLFVRDTPAAAEYQTLVEGIPRWLEGSLWRWVMDRSVRSSDLVHKAERRLRVDITPGKHHQDAFNGYWDACGEAERLALIDFFLRDLQEASLESGTSSVACHEAVAVLDEMLTEGGSVWRTTLTPYWSLVRRVNGASQALVDLVSGSGTDAARKIGEAWHACYRHLPDYDSAYREAVRAVEAAALPVMLPKGENSLGKVVAHLRDTASRWTVGGTDATQQASADTLLAMLRTLWHNQQRHAKADGTIVDVSQAEAETAVTLAVTLVHWFASGLVHQSSD